MQSICRSLGLTWRLIKYSGDDYTVIEREGKREVRPDAFSAFTRVFDALWGFSFPAGGEKAAQ